MATDSSTPIARDHEMSLSGELGERKVAADILFPKLGKELVSRLTDQLPTPRMGQDVIHHTLNDATGCYLSLLYDLTPGSSQPDEPYVPGSIEHTLVAGGMDAGEAEDIALRLQREMVAYIIEQQERRALHYETEIAPLAPYDRLKKRETHSALSTTPAEDARHLAGLLELPPSTAMRFEKAYVAYVQEQNKLHVASAALQPILFGAEERRRDYPSPQIMDAREKGEELMDSMVTMLALSGSAALPAADTREDAARNLLVRALFSAHNHLVSPVKPGISMDEPSDYRFIMGVRGQMELIPGMQARFDKHIGKLQAMADGMLDPSKISQYTGALMQKHGKELASLLEEAGIDDHRAVASRIVNIFTKQVHLVQSKTSDTHEK